MKVVALHELLGVQPGMLDEYAIGSCGLTSEKERVLHDIPTGEFSSVNG